VNLAQTAFPGEIRAKAVSFLLAREAILEADAAAVKNSNTAYNNATSDSIAVCSNASSDSITVDSNDSSGSAVAPELSGGACFSLLERILVRLYGELSADSGGGAALAVAGGFTEGASGGADGTWRERLGARLYRKDERVRFLAGGADTGKRVEGVLAGIGEAGELLIIPDGEKNARAFITGELEVYTNKYSEY
jgi:hypothetical protein